LGAHDTHVGKGCLESVPEAFPCPVSGEFGRQNPGMGILPAVMPDAG
jgi:hypothetical protein